MARVKKLIAIKNVLVGIAINAVLSARGFETHCEHFCVGSAAGLPEAKAGVIIAAAAALADQARDSICTIGKMGL